MNEDNHIGEECLRSFVEIRLTDISNFLRALDGKLTQSETDRIKQFCSICDSGSYGFNRCPCEKDGSRLRYVDRGWCGYSHIEGIKTNTTPETVDIIGDGRYTVKRDDLNSIREALEKAKQSEYGKRCLKLSRVPNPSILEVLGKKSRESENGR